MLQQFGGSTVSCEASIAWEVLGWVVGKLAVQLDYGMFKLSHSRLRTLTAGVCDTAA